MMLKSFHGSSFTTCHIIMLEQNVNSMISELATSSKIIIVLIFLY